MVTVRMTLEDDSNTERDQKGTTKRQEQLDTTASAPGSKQGKQETGLIPHPSLWYNSSDTQQTLGTSWEPGIRLVSRGGEMNWAVCLPLEDLGSRSGTDNDPASVGAWWREAG